MWFLQVWIVLGLFMFAFCACMAVIFRVFEEDDPAARAAARWAVYLLFWPLLLLAAPYFVYKWGWGEEDEPSYSLYDDYASDNPENNEEPRRQWWEMLKKGN